MYIYIYFSESFKYKVQNMMPFAPKYVTVNFLKTKGSTMITFKKITLTKYYQLIKVLIQILPIVPLTFSVAKEHSMSQAVFTCNASL